MNLFDWPAYNELIAMEFTSYHEWSSGRWLYPQNAYWPLVEDPRFLVEVEEWYP